MDDASIARKLFLELIKDFWNSNATLKYLFYFSYALNVPIVYFLTAEFSSTNNGNLFETLSVPFFIGLLNLLVLIGIESVFNAEYPRVAETKSDIFKIFILSLITNSTLYGFLHLFTLLHIKWFGIFLLELINFIFNGTPSY